MTATDTETGRLSTGHPFMRSGHGPTTILYIPGLQMQAGPASKLELGSFEKGYRPFLDVATFWTVWRDPHDGPTSMAEMAAGYADVIRTEIQPSLGSAPDAGDGAETGGRTGGSSGAEVRADNSGVGVIGLSTGGAIAQDLAVDHPELVSRLVLSLTADHFTDHGLELEHRVEDMIRRGKWRSVYAALGRVMYPTRATRMAALLWLAGPRMLGTPADPTHVLAELEAEDVHDLGARLGAIRAPTLVQGAELDEIYPPERVRALAAAIPGARHVEYPGVGHAGPGPQLLADAVEFLTQG